MRVALESLSMQLHLENGCDNDNALATVRCMLPWYKSAVLWPVRPEMLVEAVKCS